MKNLLTYEEFLYENSLSIGAKIPTSKGSNLVISKETSNGISIYRDSKGRIHRENTETSLEEETGDVQNPLAQTAEITRDPQLTDDRSSINTDPKRTWNTGTYTHTRKIDQIPDLRKWNSTDSGSGGSIPVYVGN